MLYLTNRLLGNAVGKSIRNFFGIGSQKLMPKDLKKILDKDYRFPSPDGQSYIKFASAWLWWKSYADLPEAQRRQTTPISTRHCRLVPGAFMLMHVSEDEQLLVVARLPWNLAVC